MQNSEQTDIRQQLDVIQRCIHEIQVAYPNEAEGIVFNHTLICLWGSTESYLGRSRATIQSLPGHITTPGSKDQIATRQDTGIAEETAREQDTSFDADVYARSAFGDPLDGQETEVNNIWK